MRITNLEALQTQLFDMMLEFKRVMDKEGLPYYLAYGTALGAIREGDFVPWDTDVDIVIPYEAYVQVRQALLQNLPDRYTVADTSNVKDYPYLFMRLVRRDVGHALLHLDLFPLVGTSDVRIARRLHIRLGRAASIIHWAKSRARSLAKDDSARKRRKAWVARLVFLPLPRVMLQRGYRWLAARVASGSAEFWLNLAGAYGDREYLPRTVYGAGSKALIRDVEFTVPTEFESYLESLYGNYLTPPPEAHIRAARRRFEEVYLPALGEVELRLAGGR